jgi:hypothetical protein
MSNDFVIGRYLPNFDLKNMISIRTKDFSKEKMVQFCCQILRIFFLNCQYFMMTSNSNGQIWLSPLTPIDCHFGYITKLRKETPVIQRLLP